MRRLIPFVLACLLAPTMAGPVAAAGSFSQFSPPWVAAVRNGETWSGYSDCLAGYASTSEFRCAWEFDVRSIPAGQIITAATLKVAREANCPANVCPVTLQAYYGNGTAEVSDVLAGDTVATWTPTDNLLHSFDVTNVIRNVYGGNHGYAGFNLWSKGNYGLFQVFDPTKLELDVSYAKEVDVTATPVSADGVSHGVVDGTPGSGSCTNQCIFVWPEGTKATLTATPSAGSAFLSWSKGPCSGSTSRTCAFTVPSTNFEISFVWVKAVAPTPTPPGTTPTPPGTTPAPRATSPGASSAPPTAPGGTGPAPSVGASSEPATAAPSGALGSEAPTTAPTGAASTSPGPAKPTSTGDGGVPVPIVILLLVGLIVIGAGGFWLGGRRRASRGS